jgi:DNA polymerase-3 subunit chi
MAQVDFYILNDATVAARQHFACRLADKAFRLGHRIHIQADSDAAASQIDALLWQFQALSFIPHRLQGSAQAPAPVEIGWGESLSPGCDLLINLGATVPVAFEQVARVAEIVVQEPAVLHFTRGAWRFYQERGCQLQRHDLRR